MVYEPDRDYEQDIGKFITISWRTPDGTDRFAKGKLVNVTNGCKLHIDHAINPETHWMIDVSENKVTNYFAEPMKAGDVQ